MRFSKSRPGAIKIPQLILILSCMYYGVSYAQWQIRKPDFAPAEYMDVYISELISGDLSALLINQTIEELNKERFLANPKAAITYWNSEDCRLNPYTTFFPVVAAIEINLDQIANQLQKEYGGQHIAVDNDLESLRILSSNSLTKNDAVIRVPYAWMAFMSEMPDGSISIKGVTSSVSELSSTNVLSYTRNISYTQDQVNAAIENNKTFIFPDATIKIAIKIETAQEVIDRLKQYKINDAKDDVLAGICIVADPEIIKQKSEQDLSTMMRSLCFSEEYYYGSAKFRFYAPTTVSQFKGRLPLIIESMLLGSQYEDQVEYQVVKSPVNGKVLNAKDTIEGYEVSIEGLEKPVTGLHTRASLIGDKVKQGQLLGLVHPFTGEEREALLYRIAMEKGKLSGVKAVEQIANQVLLFKIAMNAESDVASSAVAKLSDQYQVFDVAMKGKNEAVREAAVSKLNSENILKYVLECNDKSAITAVEKITNYDQLIIILTEDLEEDVQKSAFFRLTDPNASLMQQDTLEILAIQSKSDNVRSLAVGELTDQTLLEKIAVNDKNWHVRCIAVTRVNSQSLLETIAINDADLDVRKSAVEKLINPEVLTQVALKDEIAVVRKAAINKLENDGLLSQIAMSEKHPDVRKLAVEKLRNQEVLAQVALKDEEAGIRLVAVSKLENDYLFSQIAISDKDPDVRKSAVEKLVNQRAIEQVALEDWIPTVRYTAVEKLKSKKILSEIAMNDRDAEIRRLASYRLTGMKNDSIWNKITTSSPSELGLMIGSLLGIFWGVYSLRNMIKKKA